MASERRLSAIMFTDIVGYSALTQQNEALAIELLDEHHRLVRSHFPSYGGREVDVAGDGFLIEFSSAVEAANCAVGIQQAFHERNSQYPEKVIQIRIGIHVGDVVSSEGRVLGDGVNIAARVEPLAEAGGICLTQQVYDQIHKKFEHKLESWGEQYLKNIEDPVEIYRVSLPWEKLEGHNQDFSTDHKSAKPSLVVLPFVNMSGDAENEFFSDGITEEIITALSRVPGVSVISRTSAFAFKGEQITLREIGEKLSVHHVLEGSVRKAGKQVRVTAQLVKVPEDKYVWSERYDRELEDIFAIQDEIAHSIVSLFQPATPDESAPPLPETKPQDIKAYNEYLRGKYFLHQRTPEGLLRAIAHFERALAIDTQYALAYAGKAHAHNLQAEYGYVNIDEGYLAACDCARLALEVDPELPEALAAEAFVMGDYERDWKGALRLLDQAIALSPGYSDARNIYSSYLTFFGRFDEAIAQQTLAIEQDPLSIYILRNLGNIHLWARQYEQAIDALERAMELDPTYPGSEVLLGAAHLYNGDLEIAERYLLGERRELTGRTTVLTSLLVGLLRIQQEKLDQAREILNDLISQPPSHDRAFSVGALLLSLGDVDEGFKWLAQSEQDKNSSLYYLKVAPMYDGHRDDPRYLMLLQQLGLNE